MTARSRSRRGRTLRRKLDELSLLLVCCGAAILIGAGPIVGGSDGTLIQTAGGDLLVGYGLLQARKQQSRRRDREDQDDGEDEDLEQDYRAQRARRQDAPRRRGPRGEDR